MGNITTCTFIITDVEEHDITNDRSLVVCSGNVTGAINHWREYYGLPDSETPDRVFKLDTRALGGSNSGVIGWHTDQLKQVGGKAT